MASSAKHLHARGIMHGDLYAHNTLHDGEGRMLLGDFGAASFYRNDGSAMAHGLEKIEVRAFGCLLEELVDRCVDLDGTTDSATELRGLIATSLSDDQAQRPTFSEISARLTDLQNSSAGIGLAAAQA